MDSVLQEDKGGDEKPHRKELWNLYSKVSREESQWS